MKMMLLTVSLLAAGTALFAQDEAKLRDAMKKIGPTCSGLGKKIAAKDASASADAKQLDALFVDVHKFWKAKKTDDAVTLSKSASTEFKTVSQLSKAGKWDEADAAFKKATATCGGCHKAHREKGPDGSWKVK